MYETLSRVCGCLWCTHTTVPMVAAWRRRLVQYCHTVLVLHNTPRAGLGVRVLPRPGRASHLHPPPPWPDHCSPRRPIPGRSTRVGQRRCSRRGDVKTQENPENPGKKPARKQSKKTNRGGGSGVLPHARRRVAGGRVGGIN